MHPFVVWLEDHGLTRGVGDNWMMRVVTALTQGRAQADAVRNVDGRLGQYRWLTGTGRFVGANPQCVLFFRGSDSGVMPDAIAANYGAPREVVELLPGRFVGCLVECLPRKVP